MRALDGNEKHLRRITIWLPRLADRESVSVAAEALFRIGMVRDPEPTTRRASREELDEVELRPYRSAITRLGDLDALIPRWVDRLIDCVRAAADQGATLQAAISAGSDLPNNDVPGIFATVQLTRVLGAVGDRLDPHIAPLLSELADADRDTTEKICEAISYAGPALARTTAVLLDRLRVHHVWCWPSRIGRALARAAAFDESVLAGLRTMLGDEDAEVRRSALDVLTLLGEKGRPVAHELIAFNDADEQERCAMLSALGAQRTPSPEVLDLLEAALNDDNGYVRRAAIHALGDMLPSADRFVPLLVLACDFDEYLHDESLPEAAVSTLERYGSAARDALPRLMRFINGPIRGRTVPVGSIRDAILAVSGERISLDEIDPPAPRQNSPLAADEPLFAVRHRGRHCYVNRHGHMAIETSFTYGGPFHGRRAIVHPDDGPTAVIDREGRVVFESSWDDIKPYSEGLAAVAKGRKWGFVDENGRVVVQPQYDSVTRFSQGLAGVEIGQTRLQVDDLMTYDRPGRRGFIDRHGTVVVPISHHDVQPFSEGRAAVCTSAVMKPNELLNGQSILADRKYGYMDLTGRIVIEGAYSTAAPFREGVAAVTLGPVFGRSRCGYLDSDGNVVIPMEYTMGGSFKDGVAIVRRRGKRHRQVTVAIDRSGRTLLETTLQLDGGFSEGLAAASDCGTWGVIDLSGRWVIEPQFDQVEPFERGVAAVQRGDWSGLIDSNGQFLWGPTIERCRDDRIIEGEWY